MKKMMIGLLLAAAAAGAYWFLRRPQPVSPENSDQSLLTGRWRIDSLQRRTPDSAAQSAGVFSIDPNFRQQAWEFVPGGRLIQTLNDSLPADTAFYSWKPGKLLFVTRSASDSPGQSFRVARLDSQLLVLQTTDSLVMSLRRIQ